MKTISQLLAGIFIICFWSSCSKESNSDATNSSGAGGSTARFTISGNYLYVVDHTSLKAFEISNPSQPVFTSKTDVGINIETIFPYNDKLFIGSSSSMYIFSLSKPDHPQQVAKADYIIRMSCDPVVAREAVAYATLRASGPCGGGQSALVVYNISNISSPVLVNTVPLSAPYGLGMKDKALYVCEGDFGLRVYDITDAYNPKEAGSIGGDTFYDVIPYGDILIAQITGGFALYDIAANPLQPVFISKILQ